MRYKTYFLQSLASDRWLVDGIKSDRWPDARINVTGAKHGHVVSSQNEAQSEGSEGDEHQKSIQGPAGELTKPDLSSTFAT